MALVAAAVVAHANVGAAPANQILRLAGELQICTTPDPRQPSSAFHIERSATDADGDYWVAYRCNMPCADWQDCQVPLAGDAAMQTVAFVVDGMGGHLAFSTRQAGDKTVLLHTGVGGTYYMTSLARQIEDASDAKVVMVRWERGFSGWGWFTRTTAPATRVPDATRRVASVIAWTHENLAGSAAFGTVGCSMGTQATLGAVYYYRDVDAAVDYQLMVGGPGLWDINAGCARRTYPSGYCDVDATRACGSDADCTVLSPRSRCSKPGPIPLASLYEQVVNHVHATQACDVANAGTAATTIPAFDESSFAFVEGDWDFDHPIDFQMDLWGRDGDHRWAMADAMRVFNSIASAAGHPKRWYTTPDSNHCAAIGNGRALELLTAGMGLGGAVAPRPNPTMAPGATTTVDLTRLFAGGDALTFEAASNTPDLVAVQVDGGTLMLTATTEDVDGTATVTVRASNSAGPAASATFTVKVEFTPRPFLRHWRTAVAAEGEDD